MRTNSLPMEFEIQTEVIRDLEKFTYVDDDEQVSDCESSVISDEDYDCHERLFREEDLVQLDKDDPIRNVIHTKFMSCLRGEFGKKTTIVAIHKKTWSSNFHVGVSSLRLRCFEIYHQGLKNKHGDDDIYARMKYAWYGTSKENIARIMSRGFGPKDVPIDNGLIGDGLYFSPLNYLNQSVKSCVMDDDGLMHIMLCRVLLESEDIVMDCDSGRSLLNSDDSNYGVDDDDDEDVVSPSVYLVMGEDISTHILPEYVISFKAPCLKSTSLSSSSKTRLISKKPNSPWLSFPTLITVLPKLLPPRKVDLITKQYMKFKERKISRHEFIQNLKRLVGNELLVSIVKLCGEKKNV